MVAGLRAEYILGHGADPSKFYIGRLFMNPEFYQQPELYDYLVYKYSIPLTRVDISLLASERHKRKNIIIMDNYGTQNLVDDLFARLVAQAHQQLNRVLQKNLVQKIIRSSLKDGIDMVKQGFPSDDLFKHIVKSRAPAKEIYFAIIEMGLNPLDGGDKTLKKWLRTNNMDIYRSLFEDLQLDPNSIIKTQKFGPIYVINYVAMFSLDGFLFLQKHADMSNFYLRFLFYNPEFRTTAGIETYELTIAYQQVGFDVDDLCFLIKLYYHPDTAYLPEELVNKIYGLLRQYVELYIEIPGVTVKELEKVLDVAYTYDMSLVQTMIKLGYPTAALSLLVMDNGDREMQRFISRHGTQNISSKY